MEEPARSAEEQQFVKKLSAAVDGGLLDRDVLCAQVDEIRARLSEIDDTVVEKLLEATEAVSTKTACGQRTTVHAANDPMLHFFGS